MVKAGHDLIYHPTHEPTNEPSKNPTYVPTSSKSPTCDKMFDEYGPVSYTHLTLPPILLV